MRRCPDCAEENTFENLFCKQCGRCLLAPDPERVRWSIAERIEPKPIEKPKAPELVELFDEQIIKNVRASRLKRMNQPIPPVVVGWFLFLNILIFVLLAQIVMSLLN